MKQFSKVTSASLAAALTRCACDRDMQERSRVLGQQLQQEDGLGNAVRAVENFIVDELDTGKWKAKFDKRTEQIEALHARPAPGCLSWLVRLLCSPEPNRFLPPLPPQRQTKRVAELAMAGSPSHHKRGG